MIKRIVQLAVVAQSSLGLSELSLQNEQTFLSAEAEPLIQEDFDGLMKYLYQTCDGPGLFACGAAITVTSEDADEYFI